MNSTSNKLAILSWSFYDFANTIFSMNVISLYFALWVTVDKGGRDIHYSLALSGSMFAVALSVPIFGAWSDKTGRRRGPLIFLTLLCCGATAVIGWADELIIGLILFMVANYGYQSSMVFYNAMLPDIARETHVGLVSGYGVGLGYLGSIVGLLTVKPFVVDGGRPSAFVPTAILFLVFSIPCFLFVKDLQHVENGPVRMRDAWTTLLQTFREVQRYRHLLQFVLIHFLVLDVVNTIIAFMSVYAIKVIGFDDGQINSFMIFATVGAMVGSFAIGWLVRHKGARRSYWMVLFLWIVALSLATISQSETLFWVVGPLAGIGMGGVWVVSRALLVELCPSEKIGEFFGLYGMAGKMASILGPLLWGTVVLIFDATETFKYRAAVFSLLLIGLAAAFMYRSLIRELNSKS